MIRRRLSSLLFNSLRNSSTHTFKIATPSPPLQSVPQCSAFCPNPNPRGPVLGVRAYSLLSLNDLQPNVPRKQKTRKGRGIGSGKGKTAGRGHKGQKARGSHKLGFEGGQMPLRRRLPKRGFKNPFKLHFQPVGLGKIADHINAGNIDSHELITMKTLKDVGAVGKQIQDGVRLMGRGAEKIKWPIHLEVSRVTVKAKEAVEAAGGSVRRVHYNKLGLRAGGCCLNRPGLPRSCCIKLTASAACPPRPSQFHFLRRKRRRQPQLQLLITQNQFDGFCLVKTVFVLGKDLDNHRFLCDCCHG